MGSAALPNNEYPLNFYFFKDLTYCYMNRLKSLSDRLIFQEIAPVTFFFAASNGKSLKNVLLDQHLTYLKQENYSSLLKDYGRVFSVGEDIKSVSFDENCANFCLDKDCDFLTADKKSYSHFFKIRRIKSVEIFQFMKKEPKNDRPVFCVRIKTK